MEARPEPGWQFGGWDGACTALSDGRFARYQTGGMNVACRAEFVPADAGVAPSDVPADTPSPPDDAAPSEGDGGPVSTACALTALPGACDPGSDPGCEIVDVSIGGGSDGVGPCVAFSDGSVRCWSRGDGAVSYLGNDTVAACPHPGLVRGLSGVRAVRVGGELACALRSGQPMPVWCWGVNNRGEFGAPTPPSSRVPAPTALPAPADASHFVLGGSSGIALTAADTVTVWGDNAFGQLGDGTRSTRAATPHTVAMPGLRQVALANQRGAGQTACGVFDGGVLRCWGRGDAQQLGGAVTPVTSTTAALSPTTVPGLTEVRSVALAARFACAVRADDTLWCWGAGNVAGTAGIGPTPTQVLDRTAQAALAAGASCALRTDGTVWCWGEGRRVGNGGEATVAAPELVRGLTGVRRLYAGFATFCAWRGGAELWCWGDAAGVNTDEGYASTPTRVRWQSPR